MVDSMYRIEKGEGNILINSEELADFKSLSIRQDYKYEDAFLVICHALL